MKTTPMEIFAEYEEAGQFKNSVGDKGIAEQNRINERFFRGDQWRGAGTGGDRPLVRHNVIKRIGDFKMSQILSGRRNIKYTANGVAYVLSDGNKIKNLKSKILSDKDFSFKDEIGGEEINFISEVLSNYRSVCEERLNFESICSKALRDAYISGTGIVYSFWDTENGKNGDIGCEVLSVDDVYFADPYTKDIELQPYIIIAGYYDVSAVCRQAEIFSKDPYLAEKIQKDSNDGKVLVLTKFYKEYSKDGKFNIFCTKTTKSVVVRPPFVTNLSRYPFALFCFEERKDIIYGDSEVTYLIPNQIAINRMITANVWSSMSSGMPIMVVNGDTVTGEITNEPGQIIKVYGSNEDVKGAVNFVSPPDFSEDFCENINNLISNTLTQSGATAAVLGDEIIDNATALSTMKKSAIMSLEVLKNRYNTFIKDIALIWVDFFLNCYVKRKLKIVDENGIWYAPFESERYKNLDFSAEISYEEGEAISAGDKADFLLKLFDKGIIEKSELLKRLPETLFGNKEELLSVCVKERE